MSKNNLQSGPRNSRGRTSKVPLTYYRSAESGNSGNSPFKQKKPKQSKFRKFIARVVDGLLILSAILLLCYTLIVRAQPNLTVSSNAYNSKESYNKALINVLDDFKNRNKITFSEQDIASSLQKQFPEIASTSVELPIFSQTPKVNLDISSPSFLFSSNDQTYVIDSKGIAVGRLANYPGIKNLPLITDQTGFKATSGKRILSADGVRFINTVLEQCIHARVPVSSITLPALAQEMDVRTSDKPYFVKFYLGGDAYIQTGQYLSTRKQLESTHKEPAQYLDVRVNGKIFYK